MATTKEMTRTDEPQLPTAIKQFRADLNTMESQFKAALPPHIPVARFIRVALTAIQNSPRLLNCDRQSLFNSLVRCATDGLLPDGREAAIVPFGEEDDGKGGSRTRADLAQYLPMIAGIRKKIRNSGALADWNVQVVQEGDEFDFRLGDNPFIHHKPALHGGRARKVIAAYSIATYPNGTISREVMNIDQLQDIRAKSRAKKGPWADPTFFPEMCRKTVARLHSKQLPMSTDLDRIMHRDDTLYEFERARDEARKIERPGSAGAALDWFAQGGESAAPASAPSKALAAEKPTPNAASAARVSDDQASGAPAAAPSSGSVPSSVLPKTEDEYRDYARAIIDEGTNGDELGTWFRSDQQRKLRNAAGVTREVFEEVDGWLRAKCKELGQQ
jgi:recombination protein RecT